MTGSEALTLVDILLRASETGQRLNDTQSTVFLEIWAGCTYQEIADRQGYEIDYIKQIAARLWKNIGQAVGEKVSKSNLQGDRPVPTKACRSKIFTDSLKLKRLP
jgi:DNA-binding CsgD family transcriptional regulator